VADLPSRANPRHLPARPVEQRAVAALLDSPDTSLVDVVDSLLDKGVVLDGELVLGLADVDLIYLRLSVLLVAADRVLAPRPSADL
jgi:Gas vesicle protein